MREQSHWGGLSEGIQLDVFAPQNRLNHLWSANVVPVCAYMVLVFSLSLLFLFLHTPRAHPPNFYHLFEDNLLSNIEIEKKTNNSYNNNCRNDGIN